MTEQKAPNVKEMVAAVPNAVKMIKMKVNLPCTVGERVAQPGEEIEVTEAQAVELERVFVGGFSVSGDTDAKWAEQSRLKYKRAYRL